MKIFISILSFINLSLAVKQKGIHFHPTKSMLKLHPPENQSSQLSNEVDESTYALVVKEGRHLEKLSKKVSNKKLTESSNPIINEDTNKISTIKLNENSVSNEFVSGFNHLLNENSVSSDLISMLSELLDEKIASDEIDGYFSGDEKENGFHNFENEKENEFHNFENSTGLPPIGSERFNPSNNFTIKN